MRLILVLLLSLVAIRPLAADPLPSLTLAPEETTVSGLSSGGFMAVQLQVAFSANVAGAGIVAGGPYGCAGGSIWTALYVCLDQFLIWPKAQTMLDAISDRQGAIDPPEGIADDRVYLFHGTFDDTVGEPSLSALVDAYARLGIAPDRILYVSDVAAGHGFLTLSEGVNCLSSTADFINKCDVDQAGDILKWLLAPLAPPGQAEESHLLRFDQTLYSEGAPGIGPEGFVYVPRSCAEGEPCRLHIALHGCEQTAGQIGDSYARLTGYNRWAESNHVVVLYPQAEVIPAPLFNPFANNPKGCWDFWGYSGPDPLVRDAPQLAAIARMAAALGAPL